MTKLLLVRHGQSVSNAGYRTVRPHLTELTAIGEEQARLTAAALPEPGLIASSRYHRARATAPRSSRPTSLTFRRNSSRSEIGETTPLAIWPAERPAADRCS